MNTRGAASQALLALGIGAVLIGLCFFLPVSVPTGDDLRVPDSTRHEPVGAIAQGVTVTQQFPAAGPAIHEIAMQFGTYRRVNRGTLRVEVRILVGTEWQSIAKEQIHADHVQDNSFYSLDFSPPLTVAVGQLMQITMQSDSNPQQALTWWVNPEYHPDGYLLSVNGAPKVGTARFSVSYARQSGRLFAMRGAVRDRVTILLTQAWRVVLFAALGVFTIGVLLLGRRLPD